MRSRTYSQATLKKLYGKSSNQCAHPDCNSVLIADETEKSKASNVGQICHIYAFSKDGPRGRSDLTQDESNGYENLILLCAHHHAIIDTQHETYPADLLLSWKRAHENRSSTSLVDQISHPTNQLFSGSAFPKHLIDDELEQRCERLRKGRFFRGFDRVKAAERLAYQALPNGELSGGSAVVRANTLAWCSRILSRTEKKSESERFLREAELLHSGDIQDIAKAFLAENSESHSDALSKLAHLDSPISKSAAFMIIVDSSGLDESIAWLNDADITYDELAPDGKFTLIQQALSNRNWPLALEITENNIDQHDIVSTPALQGVMALAYLVTAILAEYRMAALTQPPVYAKSFPLNDSNQGLNYRNKAISLFEDTSKSARELECDDAAFDCDEFALWLKLRNPVTYETAINTLRSLLTSSKRKLRLAPLAVAFGVAIDATQIEKEIKKEQTLAGKSTFDTAMARLALLLRQGSPSSVLNYLNKYEHELTGFIEQKYLIAIKAESNATLGNETETRRLCKQLKLEGAERTQIKSIEGLLGESTGKDRREQLTALYEDTLSLANLKLLIEELRKHPGDKSLTTYARLLFEKTQSSNDFEDLVAALQIDSEHRKIVNLLEEHQEFLNSSGEIKLILALSHFYIGELGKSQSTLDSLPGDFEHPNLLILKSNLALASGNWSALTDIVTSVYNNHKNKDVRELIRFARIGFEIASPYAIELLHLAAEKAKQDPGMLLSCYQIATNAGEEENPTVAGWLHTAKKLSGSEGPVQSFSLEEILNMQPQWEEESNRVWSMIADAKAPMFVGGSLLNRSITQFIALSAISNISQADPRRKTLIPTFKGNRFPKHIENANCIGLDPSVLLTLGYLDILEKVLNSFDQFIVPHATLMWLFDENHRAEFHQPSRLRNAEAVRNLLLKGALHKLQPKVAYDSELARLVGNQLAQLLLEAREAIGSGTSKHRVVRSAPVQQIGSLQGETADLREFNTVLVGCLTIVKKLLETGLINNQEFDNAKSYLQLHEIPWADEPSIPDGCTVYLDSLSVVHLLHLGFLDKLSPAGIKAYISEYEIEEGNGLIEYRETSVSVKSIIESVRNNLQKGIANGRILLDQDYLHTEPNQDIDQSHPSFSSIKLANHCDAVFIDDRCFSSHGNIDGGMKKAPLFTTLDIIATLQSRGLITNIEYVQLKTRLRQAQFSFIPIEQNEFTDLITAANVNDGKLFETLELRVIREYVLRIQMCDWLSLPDEGCWLESVLVGATKAIRTVWESNDAEGTKAARADWLLELADIQPWAPLFVDEVANNISHARVQFIGLLITTPPDGSEEMRDAYWRWVESRIVTPIKSENPALYEIIVSAQIKVFSQVKGFESND